MAAAADPRGPVQYPSTSGMESMETSDMQRSLPSMSSMASMPASSPFTGPMNEYDSRPDFLEMAALKQEYACPLCRQVLINPQQTPCGGRACKVCLRNKFGSNTSIQCPLPHDPDEDVSLEECQRDGGLKLDDITPDASVQRVLLKKKCYCRNREYGCRATPTWRKLPEHHPTCAFKPMRCRRDLCKIMFPESQRAIHEERDCNFVPVRCQHCQRDMLRGELESHIDVCDAVESVCGICGKDLGNQKTLKMHIKVSSSCTSIIDDGRCHYFESCGFKHRDIKAMREHLRDAVDVHLEYITMKAAEIEAESRKTQDKYKDDVSTLLLKKVKPLEKATANISMEVKTLQKKIDTSDTNSDHLVNAMNTVSNNSTQVEMIGNKIGIIEKQIKDSGLDRVMVIDSHTQNIRRHSDKLSDMETRMRNTEIGSDDGTFIWKIKDYKVRKADAVRGRQMSIYSPPFYSSKFGYKMCCRAYLNGDGLGRNKCLSLFFVLMRGDFDELCQFPFQQRVTFTLLCPTNPQLSKHESFMPDPDSSSFRKPQTEMNIASGCPQFALQSDVESSNFLSNNCIYVRIRVAEGGDRVP